MVGRAQETRLKISVCLSLRKTKIRREVLAAAQEAIAPFYDYIKNMLSKTEYLNYFSFDMYQLLGGLNLGI